MTATRTAIVTGASKRVGAEIAEALVTDGWSVVAHVHHPEDAVPTGATKVVADLADRDCAERDLRRGRCASAGQAAGQQCGAFCLGRIWRVQRRRIRRAHGGQRPRTRATDRRVGAAAPGGEGLVVNLLDSKLAAPNPDYLSYTLSKHALAGLNDLAARALAPRGIRVNAIAPALMLRSSGQTEENFAAMHSDNPLQRGVEPGDVVAAIRYLVDATAVTGQVIAVDSGQRFMGLAPRRPVPG